MTETQSSQDVSTKLERIAKLAKEKPGVSLLTLAYHIDVELATRGLPPHAQGRRAGVDGQSAEQYAARLEDNLQSLLDRAKSGSVPSAARAAGPHPEGRWDGNPADRHSHLRGQGPAARGRDGARRAVYEQEFYDFSYGFRPGRSAHQALEAVAESGVADAAADGSSRSISGSFSTASTMHTCGRSFANRVRDGVLLRLIGKWLNAGVVEGLELSHPDAGTPQGGVISPLLANIYLHEVLDVWFVQRRAAAPARARPSWSATPTTSSSSAREQGRRASVSSRCCRSDSASTA